MLQEIPAHGGVLPSLELRIMTSTTGLASDVVGVVSRLRTLGWASGFAFAWTQKKKNDRGKQTKQPYGSCLISATGQFLAHIGTPPRLSPHCFAPDRCLPRSFSRFRILWLRLSLALVISIPSKSKK